MATTGKASNEQVKKQVKKVGAQLQSKSVTSAGNGRRGNGNGTAGNNNGRPKSAPAAAAAAPAGLKISFKPAELSKTTEKSVALQVLTECAFPWLLCTNRSKQPLFDLNKRVAPFVL